MADSESSVKHKCKGLIHYQSKRSKMEETMNEISPKKLTDINQFCLERIFMYLDLEDLLNVADANKKLQTATIAPFDRKFASNPVKICVHFGIPSDEVIMIDNLRTSFQQLRIFGHMITELFLDFENNGIAISDSYRHILSYVNKYCAESLHGIRFNFAYSFECITKPFPNVKIVAIRGYGFKMKCLQKYFPSLSILKLTLEDNIFPELIDHFPHLHTLSLNTCYPLNNEHKDDFKKILRLNKQLQTLKGLHLDYNSFRLLKDINRHLQRIVNFAVKIRVNGGNTRFNGKLIRFKNVNCLKVEIGAFGIPMPKIPFSFEQLEELTLSGSFQYSNHFSSFINENPLLEKFKMNYFLLNNFMGLRKVNKQLPVLRELIFSGSMSLDEVQSLVDSELLCCCIFQSEGSVNQIREISGNRWKVSVRQGHGLPQYELKRIVESNNTRYK